MTTDTSPAKVSSNPYTEMINSYVGQYFYGRHADLRLLEQSLKGPTAKSYTLIGSPKIGKTALLLKFCERARQDGPRVIVYVDCQARSLDGILERVAFTLHEELGQLGLLSDEREELRAALGQIGQADGQLAQQLTLLGNALIRTIRLLPRTGTHPVICLDHFSIDREDLQIAQLLREISAHASLIIAVEPDTLDAATQALLFITMPFVRRIGLLPFHEALELMNGPLIEGVHQAWNEIEAEGIYWIAGGNPYLLTIVCEELYAQRMRGSSVLSPHLFRRDERLVQDVETLPAVRQLFTLLWQRLKPDARELLATTARQPDREMGWLGRIADRYRDSPAISDLRDWGLIDTDNASGDLILCSRLFHRFVRAQEPPAASPINDDLISVLDELERTLRGNNEGQLLQVLRANASTVLSVDDLRRAVWKDSNEGDRHVVDQTLSRLRKRLRDQLGDIDLIRSVRGQGYVLMLPGQDRSTSGRSS
jgi:Transcriptional regulatory protein, C terminal/AAA ATPase domain